MTSSTTQAARPLSPHLQVYRPYITMVMSILHRITGGALYFGTLLVAWWLIAAASGPEHFAFVQGIYGSFLGMLILFGYTWALLHHMLGGIRHFIWDLGKGFEIPTANRMAWMTLIGSLSLTVLVWIVAFVVM
ncbi:MAG: succinate dehydrogenase, cytochrome b556 subunit [Pseudomonadota bacterium]